MGGDVAGGPPGERCPVQRRADLLPGVPAPGGGQYLQVLPPGQVAVEPWLVDDRAHPGQGTPALGGHRDAQQRHGAAAGSGQPQQDPDQRGLARPVRPQIAERGAPRDEQVHVVDGHVGAEALGEPVHLDSPVAIPAWTEPVGARMRALAIAGNSGHVPLPGWMACWYHGPRIPARLSPPLRTNPSLRKDESHAASRMMHMAWPGATVRCMQAVRRFARGDPRVITDAWVGIAATGLLP